MASTGAKVAAVVIIGAALFGGKKAVAYVNGRPTGTITLVDVDGVPVEEKTARQFRLMQAAAAQEGVVLTLSSGFRSMPDQRRMYALYLGAQRKKGVATAPAEFAALLKSAPANEHAVLNAAYTAGTGNLAAKPGFSNHQSGIALDIDVDGVFTSKAYLWMAKLVRVRKGNQVVTMTNGRRFGFVNTGANFTAQKEPWHWELVEALARPYTLA